MADRAPKSNRRRINWWLIIAAWILVAIWGGVRFWNSVTATDSTEERPLSDCLGMLERPGCGSQSRGGPYQFVVFVVMMAAFAFIGWRIWASSKKARQARTSERAGDSV